MVPSPLKRAKERNSPDAARPLFVATNIIAAHRGSRQEVGDGGRVPWVAGRLAGSTAYAGTDFIVARDGRIAAIYLFFDKLS
jgi:hypothetical protein